MIWTLAIIVVVIFGVKFFKDYTSQANEIASSGGMKIRYSILINRIISDDYRNQVVDQGNNFIVVGYNSHGGSYWFDISENFGGVTIKYYSKNIAKDFEVVREFDVNENQNAMYEIFKEDLVQANTRILKNLKNR